MCKYICSLFSKNKQNDEYIDKDRKAMREHFGIKDKYLIEYCLEDVSEAEKGQYKDGKKGFVVFIDDQNDIDWKSEYDPSVRYGGEDGAKKFESAIARLNVAHAHPCNNLSEENILIFRKMLGSAYVLAICGEFEGIDATIKEAVNYVTHRNAEAARKFFLTSSSIISIVVCIAWAYIHLHTSCEYKPWVAGIAMGVLGAYVSIWIKYGKKKLTGLSSKPLHYLESATRLFVGSVFAMVAMFALECNLILPSIDSTSLLYAYALSGFLAGFCEQFIPSLMEKISNHDDK